MAVGSNKIRSIVLFIVPPSGVVLLQVMAGISICVGCAVGWVWGVITMKASLATRPDEDLQAQYAKLQQAISQGEIRASGSTPAAQVALYNGFFLDTRVSICTFCMISLFIYLMVSKGFLYSW